MGENDFELSIPRFVGLQVVFNVELIRPYFPCLLDTSKVYNQIMDTEMKGTRY